MLSLIARALLLVAATITGWLVAKDAPNFSTIQISIALLLFVVFVFVLAFWPSGWSNALNRHKKSR